jgi:hypothetical protein
MFSRKHLALVLCAALVVGPALKAVAQFDKPEIKKWQVMEKNDKGEDKPVNYMTIDGVLVHEEDPAKQPQPTVITPGLEGSQEKTGTAPSDAIVLFDGKDLSSWTAAEKDKEPTKWRIEDGAMISVKGAGMIQSKQEFGSCQLHVEWAAPSNVEGEGQGRGNSGVFLMGQYEVQVLDSYENKTYPDGQAGALYGRSKPLVNACRKPGEWQSYDIIFHRPVFEDGKVVKRATFTVIHNGVVIQDHTELSGGTLWDGKHSVIDYAPHGDKGPIMLQDHGNPVRFRNVWVRELKD